MSDRDIEEEEEADLSFPMMTDVKCVGVTTNKRKREMDKISRILIFILTQLACH